jgi:uncharacterized protein YjbI with pentapeptide repeats
VEAVVDVCSEPECEAASFAGGDCLAHASVEDLQFEALLLRAGKLVDARGATIDAAALRRLWAALGSEAAASDGSLREPDRRGARIMGAANFNGAIFTDQAVFAGVTFDGPAYFDGAVFEAGVDFNDVSFGEHADFDGVRVDGLASFQRARFADHVGFEGGAISGPDTFRGRDVPKLRRLRGREFRRFASNERCDPADGAAAGTVRSRG